MVTKPIIKIHRDGWVFLLCSGLFVGLIALSLNYNKPALKGSFWQKDNLTRPGSSSEFQEMDKNLDISTPAGWRGKVKVDPARQQLVINLVDFMGEPVRDIFLAAQIFTRQSNNLVYQGILNQDKDGKYRSGKLGVKPGNWDLAVTARNPNSAFDTDFLFHLEKQIKVEQASTKNPNKS